MRIALRTDAGRRVVYSRELADVLEAAVKLANAADTLLELAPGDVNPIVFARAHLEPLRIARGSLVDVGYRHRLVTVEAPA